MATLTCPRCHHPVSLRALALTRSCTVAGAQGSKTPPCGCFHGSAVLKEMGVESETLGQTFA